MDAVAECTACCPPHRLIMIHGRNGAAEKLDQNIPIDRKDGRCTQLRSTELHTFVNSTPVTTTSTSAPTTTSRRHLVLNINTKNFKKNTSIAIDRKDIPSHHTGGGALFVHLPTLRLSNGGCVSDSAILCISDLMHTSFSIKQAVELCCSCVGAWYTGDGAWYIVDGAWYICTWTWTRRWLFSRPEPATLHRPRCLESINV